MQGVKSYGFVVPLIALAILATVPGFAQSAITVNTDKGSFSAGEQISITGNVQNAQAGTPVAIEIRDGDGQTLLVRTVQTDEDGDFALQFRVPQSANEGEFTIFANANVGGETATITKEVAISSQQTSSSGGSSTTTSQCIIATAAFGSEIAPQVQFLRNFRDSHILSTTTGSSFMNVFNTWYYSFSPQVADYERGQPWMQQTVRVMIYPLLGILHISEGAYNVIPGEYGSIVAGLVASALIGAIYASPMVLSVRKIRKFRLDLKIAISIIASIAVSVLASVAMANDIALMVTTPALVVTTLSIAAILSANTITRIICYLRTNCKKTYARSRDQNQQ